MIQTFTREEYLYALEKTAKGSVRDVGRVQKFLKSIVGTRPSQANPLSPGRGLMGFVGRRAKTM